MRNTNTDKIKKAENTKETARLKYAKIPVSDTERKNAAFLKFATAMNKWAALSGKDKF